MKKIFKAFLILATMLAFSMNLSVYATNTEISTNNSNVILVAANSSDSESNNSSANIGTADLTNDAELQLPDILNILLIATGVVIIMLAIAIFIRLK